MGKRTKRLMVTAVAGLLAMSLGSAHADVSVSIDNEDGSIVWAVPGLPGPVDAIEVGPFHVDPIQVGPVHAGPVDVPVSAVVGPIEQPSYPDAMTTKITGSATFDSIDGSAVLYQFSAEGVDGETIVVYSGEASRTCGDADENGVTSCTYSFGVPFGMGAGEYTVTVTADQVDPIDPEARQQASESITVTVI